MKRITLVCIFCGFSTLLQVFAATNTVITAVSKREPYLLDAAWMDKANQWEENSTRPGLKWADLSDTTTTLSNTGTVLLATLTSLSRQFGREPRLSPVITSDQRQTTDVRRKLFEANILPVWNGSAWVDGKLLAANGYDLSEKCAQCLLELNYYEYMFGYSSVPPEIRKDVTLNGGAWAQLGLRRWQLLDAGYRTGFDTNLCVWRIASTNVPTAHSP